MVLVAIAVVAVVFGAALVTQLVPEPLQDVVFETPAAIGVLIVGTGWVLWHISRGETGAPDR